MFFKNIFQKSLTYKFGYTIANLYKYIKDYNLIHDTLYSDAFKIVIKKYLNVELRKDWIGRLYGVANPSMNDSGHFDVSNMIIEFDDNLTNNNEHIKQWTFKQMRLIGQLFKINNLYNYIDITFKHVGPENFDNYLLIFDIVSRKNLSASFKKFIIHALIYFILFEIVHFSVLYFI